jgi:intraflagellar transport protein 81
LFTTTKATFFLSFFPSFLLSFLPSFLPSFFPSFLLSFLIQVMQREEFQAFALKLRKKKGAFVTCKQELSKLQARAVVAARTEQVLKGRDRNAEEVIQAAELQQGTVVGYNTTQQEIEKAAQDTRDTDEMKGKTLEEISQLSIKINAQLKSRHSQLQPKVQKLREVRKEYKSHESDYLREKEQFSLAAVDLQSKVARVEKTCNEAQENALRLEGEYHGLHARISLRKTRLSHVEAEERFLTTSEELTTGVKSFKALYEQKKLAASGQKRELMKLNREKNDSLSKDIVQRRMFLELQQLLDTRLRTMKDEGASKRAAQGAGAADIEIGGANVMRIG